MKFICLFVLLGTWLGIFLSGCGGTTASAVSKVSSVNFAVNFTASSAVKLPLVWKLLKGTQTRSPCVAGATTDAPGITAGLDCDGDGGVVAYQTPTAYKIAYRSIYLKVADGTKKYLVNFSALNQIDSTGVFSFTPSSATAAVSIPAAASGFETSVIGAEIYYIQMKIKLYNEQKEIRVYMSDDDFSSQGSLGHHQGDLTYFDDSGVEHWAKGGANWLSSPATTLARGSFADGAAGIDSETGHARGMFGNAAFWNQSTLAQGSAQDIFYFEKSYPGTGVALTVTYDVSNTWFYEDFYTTNSGSFDPCSGSTLEGCGGEWAPLFPSVSAVN